MGIVKSNFLGLCQDRAICTCEVLFNGNFQIPIHKWLEDDSPRSDLRDDFQILYFSRAGQNNDGHLGHRGAYVRQNGKGLLYAVPSKQDEMRLWGAAALVEQRLFIREETQTVLIAQRCTEVFEHCDIRIQDEQPGLRWLSQFWDSKW
jgi:hypothetical protein